MILFLFSPLFTLLPVLATEKKSTARSGIKLGPEFEIICQSVSMKSTNFTSPMNLAVDPSIFL